MRLGTVTPTYNLYKYIFFMRYNYIKLLPEGGNIVISVVLIKKYF
jgi:hypothetical protein